MIGGMFPFRYDIAEVSRAVIIYISLKNCTTKRK